LLLFPIFGIFFENSIKGWATVFATFPIFLQKRHARKQFSVQEADLRPANSASLNPQLKILSPKK
jgi:hypothetical protein